MPITRDEFESGQIDRRQDVLSILLNNRDRAYSQDELLTLVNFQGSVEGARSRREFAEELTSRPPTTQEQLDDVLQVLLTEELAVMKELEGTVYYMSGVRSP